MSTGHEMLGHIARLKQAADGFGRNPHPPGSEAHGHQAAAEELANMALGRYQMAYKAHKAGK